MARTATNTDAHASSGRGRTRADARSNAQTAAAGFGAVYVLVGIVGWFVTSQFIGADHDDHLLGFHLNGAHNVVHLALGGVWLAAAARRDWARAVNTVLGATLLLVGLLGLTGVLHTLLNIENAVEPDNYLHLVTGAASLWFGIKDEGPSGRS